MNLILESHLVRFETVINDAAGGSIYKFVKIIWTQFA